MNKKLFVIAFFLTPLALFIPYKLKAQESTATASPTTDPDTIKGVREEIEKKVRDKLEEIVNKQTKVGWIGEVTDVSETGFKIEVDGENRTATFNEDAVIIDTDRQQLTFDDLEKGQRVIAMGYSQIDGTLDARRIVFTGKKEPRDRQAIFGTITEKAEQDEIMLVRNGQESYELILDNNSAIEMKTDGEITEIEYDELAVDQKIAAVISPTDGNTKTYEVEELLVISSPAQTEEATPTESEETGTEMEDTDTGTTATETGTTAP